MDEIKRAKTSWYIDEDVIEAMNLVKDVEGIPIGRQVELAAKIYLKRYEDLIGEHGINVWKPIIKE